MIPRRRWFFMQPPSDLHGVGQYAAESITNLDLPPILGVTLFGAFFIVTFSAIVDILYFVQDFVQLTS